MSQMADIVRAQATAAAEQQILDLFKYLKRSCKFGVSKLHYSLRTLGASASENLDLAGGLTDSEGATLTLTKLRAIAVHALAANTNDVVVGGAASNQLAGLFGNVNDIINLKPGGLLLYTCPTTGGITVTATSGDLLKVLNSAGSTGVTYELLIIGD